MIIRYARDIQTYSYFKKIKRHILQQFNLTYLRFSPVSNFSKLKYFLSMTEFSLLNNLDKNSPIHHWWLG